nr:hypothetical protein KPHV_23900 [Kitasatospora purpeofusca]
MVRSKPVTGGTATTAIRWTPIGRATAGREAAGREAAGRETAAGPVGVERVVRGMARTSGTLAARALPRGRGPKES